MGSKQEQRTDERRRRDNCPNCDVTMLVRWLGEADTVDGGRLRAGHYARCGQCLTVFVLTSAGWEEATRHDER